MLKIIPNTNRQLNIIKNGWTLYGPFKSFGKFHTKLSYMMLFDKKIEMSIIDRINVEYSISESLDSLTNEHDDICIRFSKFNWSNMINSKQEMNAYIPINEKRLNYAYFFNENTGKSFLPSIRLDLLFRNNKCYPDDILYSPMIDLIKLSIVLKYMHGYDDIVFNIV